MDFPRVVDEILQLLPETQQVFVILGSGVTGRFWRPELEDEFKRFQDRLTFVWSEESIPSEILRRSASLPDNSAILYITSALTRWERRMRTSACWQIFTVRRTLPYLRRITVSRFWDCRRFPDRSLTTLPAKLPTRPFES